MAAILWDDATCEAQGCGLEPALGGDLCAFHECQEEERRWRGRPWVLETFNGPTTIFALCWCGNRAKGRGLCPNHLSQQYRRETGRVSGPPAPARIPLCHPDRKHKAHGMCGPCFRASPDEHARMLERSRRCKARRRAAKINPFTPWVNSARAPSTERQA